MNTDTDITASDERILFVDDNQASRKFFSNAARRLGFCVDVADSGPDAITMIQRQSYAVVATDLRMPEMDGLELIEHLLKLTTETIYVLVTAATDIILPENSAAARAITAILFKPLDIDELNTTLKRAIQLHHRKGHEHAAESQANPNASAVLLIEAEARDARIISLLLSREIPARYRVHHVERLQHAVEILDGESFQIVLADLSLPDARGLDSVSRLRRAAPDIPIIALARAHDEALATEAVQAGAQDYLVKGEINQSTLHRAMRYAMERKISEERLAHLAHYDQLTGLCNRVLFQERLARAIARAERTKSVFGILFIDLDHFKEINDTLGHDAGDLLLTAVGQRLRDVARSSDTVARLGGDEFALIAEDIARGDLSGTVAERLLQTLREPIRIGAHEVVLTSSIGIAIYPASGTSCVDLLKSADSAMYRAKESGRNNYQFFSETIQVAQRSQLKLEKELRSAVKRHELVVYYQPQLTLETGATVGVEALVRWRHPELGLILPNRFIPLLERMGHIIEVGEWILHSACEVGQRWQEIIPGLRMSVNLSPRQFEDSGLIDKVEAALGKSGLPANQLELEITESLSMKNTALTSTTLTQLRRLGVRFAIDDFGTGYSSLAYLNQFPLDTLKIDRSFVTAIRGEPDGKAIVASVISLGHSLGLEVIAEGVETGEQIEFLRQHKCDMWQGFLSCHPQSRAKIEQWLRRRVATAEPARENQ